MARSTRQRAIATRWVLAVDYPQPPLGRSMRCVQKMKVLKATEMSVINNACCIVDLRADG